MKRVAFCAAALFVALAVAVPATAHVTIQPNEAVVGSFSRFVVRVPNEADDASTIEVEVIFPPMASVSFEDADGWQRDVETVEFDEPLDVFGQEVTEGVGSATWSGGEVGPGEFTEFGFSARMPDAEEDLVFEAIQTYDSGEVVEWAGPPDAEEPAPHLNSIDIGAEEGQSTLGVIAEMREQLAAGNETGSDSDSDESDSPLPAILGGAGVLLGAAALIVALSGRRA